MLSHINLFESYNSIKEIKKLSSDILEVYLKEIINIINVNDYSINVEKLYTLQLNSINSNNYSLLSEFIEESNLLIDILSIEEFNKVLSGSKAAYVIFDDKNDILRKMIALQYDEYTFRRIEDDIKSQDSIKDINLSDLWASKSVLLKQYNKSLIHELTHAYDDFRTNGKYKEKTKLDRSFKQSPQKSVENMNHDERERFSDYNKNYLNLSYEIDARFSDTVTKINFYDLDLDLTFENYYNTYLMRDFRDVYKDFKRNLLGFDLLSHKEKRRLQTKLGQFYILEDEYINKLNKEEKEKYEESKINENDSWLSSKNKLWTNDVKDVLSPFIEPFSDIENNIKKWKKEPDMTSYINKIEKILIESFGNLLDDRVLLNIPKTKVYIIDRIHMDLYLIVSNIRYLIDSEMGINEGISTNKQNILKVNKILFTPILNNIYQSNIEFNEYLMGIDLDKIEYEDIIKATKNKLSDLFQKIKTAIKSVDVNEII